ncbi:MAG: SDR family oxidoreductase [Cyanobacteria bacterium J06633_8]
MSNVQFRPINNIEGKTVVLTGASRGIGAFIARELAKKQATVICISRSVEGLDKICNEINDLGGKGIGINFNISNVERMPELMYEIEQVTGSFDVDILINNAGIEIYRAFHNYSLKDIQLVLSVNLLAAIELSRLVLPHMLDKANGHIINITSLATKKGLAYDSVYSASKAGLITWADTLQQELANTNIKISNISPESISGQALFADTGISTTLKAAISIPEKVAIAVCYMIENNGIEIVENGNFLTRNIMKLKFAFEEHLPRFGDDMKKSLHESNSQ